MSLASSAISGPPMAVALPPLPPSPTQPVETHCQVCESLIYDWLIMPLVNGEYFYDYVKYKRLRRVAPQITKELYRFFTLQKDSHKERMKHVSEKISMVLPVAQVRVYLFIYAEVYEEDTIKAIKVILEDSSAIDRMLINVWIGHIIGKMWPIILNVHKEHQGLQGMTYGGAAHGMRSFRNLSI